MYYYIKTKHFFMEIIIYTCFATDEDVVPSKIFATLCLNVMYFYYTRTKSLMSWKR